eukprot:g45782.t1
MWFTGSAALRNKQLGWESTNPIKLRSCGTVAHKTPFTPDPEGEQEEFCTESPTEVGMPHYCPVPKHAQLSLLLSDLFLFQVKIQGQNKEMLAAACQMFLGKSETEIGQIALETLEGHQRAIMAHMTVEEIYKDRKKFSEQVFKVASSDLVNMGIGVVSYTLKDIHDDQGYLHSLGKSRTAQVQRDARIGEAEAKRDSGIKVSGWRDFGESWRRSMREGQGELEDMPSPAAGALAGPRQGLCRVRGRGRGRSSAPSGTVLGQGPHGLRCSEAKAQQQKVSAQYVNEIEVAKAQRDYELKKAVYDTEVNTKKATSDLAYQLQVAKTKQQIEEEKMQVQVVERAQQIQVQEQEILRREKELEAKVKKPAEAERYRLEKLAEAERLKLIMEAEAEAESIRRKIRLDLPLRPLICYTCQYATPTHDPLFSTVTFDMVPSQMPSGN